MIKRERLGQVREFGVPSEKRNKMSRKRRNYLLIREKTRSKLTRWILLIVTICSFALLLEKTKATTSDHQEHSKSSDYQSFNDNSLSSKSLPANHRMDALEYTSDTRRDQPNATTTSPDVSTSTPFASSNRRNGRQYDASSMSTSGTGNYAAIASGESAYVGAGLPASASGAYNSAAAAAAANSAYAGALDQLNASPALYSAQSGNAYQLDQLSLAARAAAAAGYPSMHPVASYPAPLPPFSGNIGGGGGGGLASMFGPGGSAGGGGGGGLFGSAGFPLMTKAFDISEIVCTAIAVAIGAVIVGAPFILLYLFVMNQMQSNGPNAMGPNGGSISLTGPTSSTNVGGRKKRHTSLPEALFKQLSPLINNEQVAQTFKSLLNSIAKYQSA